MSNPPSQPPTKQHQSLHEPLVPTQLGVLLAWGVHMLKPHHEAAALEAELLLGHTLAKNRAYLFAHPEQMLNVEQTARYQALITQRAQGRPIAYITGQREFWSLDLAVNEHTLIPRHETERLVELALELLPKDETLFILDLGTGSGAIALALASERPRWQITACDKSPDALTVAQNNATQLNISNITFYQSDWFATLPSRKYHAILSNPPYIAPDDPHLQLGDVRFEPISALVSESDGLTDLKHIIKNSIQHLYPEGIILVEHGYEQKTSITSILNELRFCEVQCWQDICGRDRVSGGKKPK